jgi:hypothetical protein
MLVNFTAALAKRTAAKMVATVTAAVDALTLAKNHQQKCL